jgi:hypothetical protein
MAMSILTFFLLLTLGFVCSVTYQAWLRRENTLRDRGERDEIITGVNDKREDGMHEKVEELARKNGRFASVEEAKMVKGDGWSGYRYTL